ncbi:MAG: glycosyltransferase family 2 protein [Flavobacteriaceae bacterium]|nr:glycosyltransferase family 2 protein [Flavobacteriaceae bacterium]
MVTQPLVSIIMAVKDTASYLTDCLDSIIDQTYQNWELIAVNDHSSDQTPTILKEYSEKDSRIKYYDSDTPKLIPTLQYAYKKANGCLINRMDSDDKMPDYKIEVLVKEWLKYGKGHVIVGGTKHFVDEGQVGQGFINYENWLNEVTKTSTHYQQIYTECVIPSHCWLIHKTDFDQIDAFNPLIYPEDYDLCFRMYKAKLNVIGIDVILHHWRDRSDRISRTWEEYKDNRYFNLKMHNFFELDRNLKRPLVIWGAGKNGKDLAKLILEKESDFFWVSDNKNKINKDIYGIRIQHQNTITELDKPQILIAVSSPDNKIDIANLLKDWNKTPVEDYWFFI